MGRACRTHGEEYEEENKKKKGKTALEGPRHKQEYNTKMDLREIGWDDMDWINLVEDKDQWWLWRIR